MALQINIAFRGNFHLSMMETNETKRSYSHSNRYSKLYDNKVENIYFHQ